MGGSGLNCHVQLAGEWLSPLSSGMACFIDSAPFAP